MDSVGARLVRRDYGPRSWGCDVTDSGACTDLGPREDFSLLTRLNLLLEKVAELGAPRDVASVVVRRVEVLVPRGLGQRNLATEWSHGPGLGRAR